jgi:hypothetical protein
MGIGRLKVIVGLALASSSLARAQLPRSLSDSAFASLVARFSEPEGYFDTDNIISNEDSYLHPLTTLDRLKVSGGVYVGVGPDQNFSYIAAIRPKAAVIIDIRRGNLLEHLLFKEIFARSRGRADYLALLFGKLPPRDTTGFGARSVDSLIAWVRTAPAGRPIPISPGSRPLTLNDLAEMRRLQAAFIAAGPSLRFNSYGRAPSAGYPDFASLAAATDRAGRQRSFLASEQAFRFVKNLEDRNLIIPVVGNFAGDRAFAAVGAWMRQNGEQLSALYASNVEQYLWQDDVFPAFVRNVGLLPRTANSVIIRSCFNFCRRGHPQSVGSSYSVQMVQLADTLLALRSRGQINSYFDLVSTGLVPP